MNLDLINKSKIISKLKLPYLSQSFKVTIKYFMYGIIIFFTPHFMEALVSKIKTLVMS